LRQQVEGHVFPGEERLPGGTLTISIGVATHVSAGSKEALLQAADAALYAAKSEGRNRVCVAASTPDGDQPSELPTPPRALA
jgi:diguanylate cyclase (GGDEF)-like protein